MSETCQERSIRQTSSFGADDLPLKRQLSSETSTSLGGDWHTKHLVMVPLSLNVGEDMTDENNDWYGSEFILPLF